MTLAAFNEYDAHDAYYAIAAALTRAGFGWVIQQVEDSLADDELSGGPITWIDQLRELVEAVKTTMEFLNESRFNDTIAAADRLLASIPKQ